MSGPAPEPPQEPVELPEGVEHGSFTAYQRKGCRCGPCQEHMRAYTVDAAKVRRRRPVPENVTHGRSYTYTYYHCRCEWCCEARRSYDRERYETRQARREQP